MVVRGLRGEESRRRQPRASSAGAGEAREAPQGRKAGQQRGCAVTRASRRPARHERERSQVVSRGTAPATQRERPVDIRGAGPTGAPGQAPPGEGDGRMAPVVERTHRVAALARVPRQGGRPGGAGRPGEEWPGSLQAHGPESRDAWLAGRSPPHPGKRVERPQPGGGVRQRGLPTVLDRCIQPARGPGRPPAWDGPFADGRCGGRPGRSAHDAIAPAQPDRKAG